MSGASTILAIASQGMSIIKSATEIAKTIKDVSKSSAPDREKIISDTVEVLRGQLAELQYKHLALQQLALEASERSLSLHQQNAALQEKLLKSDQFEMSRDKYERVTLALNTVAYRERSFNGAADDQPLYCPQCFDAGTKKLLTFEKHAPQTKQLQCTVCSYNAHIARDDGPSIMTAPIRRSIRGWDDAF